MELTLTVEQKLRLLEEQAQQIDADTARVLEEMRAAVLNHQLAPFTTSAQLRELFDQRAWVYKQMSVLRNG